MDTSLWVQLVSTVSAAVIGAIPPALALWLTARTQIERRSRRSAHRRAWWISAFCLVAVTVTAGLLTSPLGWALPPITFVVIALCAVAVERHRASRRSLLDPEVCAFAERHASVGGYPYDPGSMPELLRVYTTQDLTDTPDRDAHDLLRKPLPSAGKNNTQTRHQSIDTILTDALLRHVVITGEGGIGKTSLLAYLSFTSMREWKELSARQRSDRTRLGGLLPIQIPARAIVNQPSLAAAFGDAEAELLSNAPAPGAQWLVSIDALDEVTDSDDRSKVVERIFAAMDNVWPCRFIVTTRNLDDSLWRGLRDRDATEFRLQPFTREQLFNYLVTSQVSNRARLSDPAIRAIAEAKANRFLKRAENSGGLIDLLRLPLLARVAATIYFNEEGRDDIPARRVDIYKEAVDHWLKQFRKRLGKQHVSVSKSEELLHRWKPRTPAETSELERLRSFLSELAHRHLEDGQQPIRDLAGEMLQVAARPKGTAEWKALHALLEATGLIHDVDSPQPRFLHKTFAEYLAAPLRKDLYGDIGSWTQGLQNADGRWAAVFAYNHLPPSERRTLAIELSGHGSSIVAAGWLVAEGLCVADHTDRQDTETNHRIIDALFDSHLHYVTEGWDTVVAALASMQRTRAHILDMVKTETCAPHRLPFLAGLIARYDARGVKMLRDYCLDTAAHERHRIEAAQHLMAYDEVAAKSSLRKIAVDVRVNSDQRLTAAQVLMESDSATAKSVLGELASAVNYDGLHQVMAAEVFARIDPTCGVPVLRDIGTNPNRDAFDRARALTVLSQFDSNEAVRLMTAVATDSEEETKTQIIIAGHLSKIDITGIEILHDVAANAHLPHDLRLSAAGWLSLQKDPAGETHLVALGSDRDVDVYTRFSAAMDLGRQDRAAASMIFRDVLVDASKESSVHTIAAAMLAYFGNPEGIVALRRLVGDNELSHDRRISAAEELGTYDQHAAISFLRKAADDSTLRRMDRSNAEFHFQKLSPESISALAKRAGDSSIDGYGRILAADALADRHWRAGVGALTSLAADGDLDGGDRLAAAEILAEISAENAIAVYEFIAADMTLTDAIRSEATASLAMLSKAPGSNIVLRGGNRAVVALGMPTSTR